MKPWSPDEPARQPAYRRFKYRLELLEDIVAYQQVKINELNQRIEKLEHDKIGHSH